MYSIHDTHVTFKTANMQFAHISEFLIRFEAWAKLAQQRLVCAPLGIHLEPINKELMLLVTI